MARKLFCDICDEEITRNYATQRISGRGYQPDGNSPLMVEIVVGSERGVWNDGEVWRDVTDDTLGRLTTGGSAQLDFMHDEMDDLRALISPASEDTND